MHASKRATNPLQFADLLEVFPCPAWIEDFSSRILARNKHPRRAKGLHPAGKIAYPLPAHGSTKGLSIVALLPAGQETECQRRVICSLLGRMPPDGQAAAVDEALLTPRQREIYHELAKGFSYKEVATNLGISPTNVQVQTTRMRKILGPRKVPLLRRKTQGKRLVYHGGH